MNSNLSNLSNGMNVAMGGNAIPESIHYTEEIIGLDRRLTVVGTVCDKMGDLRLESTSKNKVIISTKSADDMVADAQKDQASGKRNSVIFGAIGLVLLIIGIIGTAIGGGDDTANNAPQTPAAETTK